MQFSNEKVQNRISGKIVECSRRRMKEFFSKWHQAGQVESKKRQSMKNIFNKLLQTKIGRVFEAFSKWKSLP